MSRRRRILELAGVVHRNHSDAFRILKEEEGDDDADLFGDTGDDSDTSDDNTDDADAGDDADDKKDDDKDKEEPEDDEPAVKVSKEDEALLGPAVIDRELDTVFTTAFDKAMASAVVNSDSPSYPGGETDDEKVEESLKRRSLSALLLEEEDPSAEIPPDASEFDMEYFTTEVARYINNYENIMDMEGMIFNKARQMLMNKFGQAAADDMEELLAYNHGIDLKEKFKEEPQERYAAGAAGEGGGA